MVVHILPPKELSLTSLEQLPWNTGLKECEKTNTPELTIAIVSPANSGKYTAM